MTDYIEQFSAYLYEVKKSSKNTLDAYIRDIKQFCNFCAINGINDLNKVNEGIICNYIEHLNSLGKSDATKSRVAASIRCYYKYLISIEICKNNPADSVKFKKAEQKMPGILDTNEILLLLSQPNGKDYKSIRDRAMLELLYATGIKVSELINLKLYDINVQLGILHLHSEKNERVIPIYPVAVKHISDYLQNARSVITNGVESDVLFTNMNGQPMSRQGFWKIIKYYAEAAGIKKDITPHTLRHSFAAHLLENGAQLKDIKDMLGHSDISSTQIYAQMIKNKYSVSYSKYHPLAKSTI